MAKQQVVTLDSGATLIYQKQNSFNGYSFVIGFNSGAKLDGQYKGLSHLLEHLLFRSSKDNVTNNILNNILRYTINQNAFTSKESICMDFSAVQDNVELVLTNCMKMFMNDKFTQEQIDREIEIVKHEIRRQRPQEADMVDLFLDSLVVNPKSMPDILGNSRTLGKITPEVLSEYVHRYFNLENLIISVTSNKPLSEVIKLCEEKIISKVPHATDEKYIMGYPVPQEYQSINLLLANPTTDVPDMDLALLLRDRMDFTTDVDKEYAMDIIEAYMMNTIGGALWQALRVKKSLVYEFALEHLDLGSTKFKMFYASTDKTKMRATIQSLCGVIKNIAENGVDKKMFETVKATLLEQNSATLQKFKRCSAASNYQNWFHGIEFVDYKKVMNYIKDMTYEEFNKEIRRVYAQANVSLVCQGNFDSRKLYNLVEIEKMLGNNTHASEVSQLNVPRIEATQIGGGLDLSAIVGQFQIGAEDAENQEEVVESVDMDDKPLDEEN